MISETTIDEFQRMGVVLLRGLFTDWVDSLGRGVERNMAEPGPWVRDYHEPGEGRFFGDFCNWRRIPEYREFVFESPAARVAAELMRSRTARIFHDHVLVKEPDTRMPTPWHHDQPYYCVDGRQNCSLWLALDPVPAKTAVEFIAGSHAWGRWFRPERFDGSALYDDDGFETLPDIDGRRDEYDLKRWPVAPGDAVAFHFLTLHSAPANRSPTRRRRAFSSRWIGDDAVFARRGGRTSPPFPELTLRPGEPMDAPEFPIIFDAARDARTGR